MHVRGCKKKERRGKGKERRYKQNGGKMNELLNGNEGDEGINKTQAKN